MMIIFKINTHQHLINTSLVSMVFISICNPLTHNGKHPGWWQPSPRCHPSTRLGHRTMTCERLCRSVAILSCDSRYNWAILQEVQPGLEKHLKDLWKTHWNNSCYEAGKESGKCDGMPIVGWLNSVSLLLKYVDSDLTEQSDIWNKTQSI